MVQSGVDPNSHSGTQRFAHLSIPIKYQHFWLVLQFCYPRVGSFAPLLMLIIDIMHYSIYLTNTGKDKLPSILASRINFPWLHAKLLSIVKWQALLSQHLIVAYLQTQSLLLSTKIQVTGKAPVILKLPMCLQAIPSSLQDYIGHSRWNVLHHIQ